MRSCDILISGGGIAGLTAAAVFGAAGFDVILVDPAPPSAPVEDLRSTALLQPARDLLQDAGVWGHLAPIAAPLQVMRIVDASGDLFSCDFDASDISDDPFGWNFPNRKLREALEGHLQSLPNVTLLQGRQTTGLLTRSVAARVTLGDGEKVTAKLVIAADGRNSFIRDAVGIPVTTKRHGQKAIVFAATHPIPHENISTEIHQSGGPFTLVPLPDQEGMPCSAIVWMDHGADCQDRMTHSKADFEAAATERSQNLFGPLTLAGDRQVWPIISQHATRLVAQRTALIAEAAHVLPPIGAQGLNMSLADIAALLKLSQAHRDDLGNAAMLAAYQKNRLPNIRQKITGIDLLNRASQAGHPVLQGLRAKGLSALHQITPVRQSLMKMGLGLRG